jgi:predicted transposase YdaD
VQSIYLDELDSSKSLFLGTSLIQLIVTPENRAIAEAKQLLARVKPVPLGELSQQEVIEAVTTTIVYKFTNLSRAEVEAMLGTTIQQIRVYQDAFAEGRQKGEKPGQASHCSTTSQSRYFSRGDCYSTGLEFRGY